MTSAGPRRRLSEPSFAQTRSAAQANLSNHPKRVSEIRIRCARSRVCKGAIVQKRAKWRAPPASLRCGVGSGLAGLRGRAPPGAEGGETCADGGPRRARFSGDLLPSSADCDAAASSLPRFAEPTAAPPSAAALSRCRCRSSACFISAISFASSPDDLNRSAHALGSASTAAASWVDSITAVGLSTRLPLRPHERPNF